MRPKLLLRYIFVTLVLLFAVLGVVPDSYAWLSGWDKRIELTTDHTVVDATLSNFPVYVNLSTSSGKTSTDVSAIFDEVGANWQKIAIANSSDVECYVEKVSWDSGTELAELHTKYVSVSNSADENWYLYYDNDHADNTVYVKGVGDATDVWDSNFKMVQHMGDASTSTVTDSTSNSNDGTKKAANEPIEATGQIGKGQDFDGSDDYIGHGSDTSLDDIAIKTIELWTNLDAQNGTGIASQFINKNVWFLSTDPDNSQNIFGQNFTTYIGRWSFPQFSLSEWHHLVVVYDRQSVNNDPIIYVDDISQTVTEYNTPDGSAESDASDVLLVSKYPNYDRWVDGCIDEVRVSNIARSADWTKTSYYSGNDNLLTFGNEETQGAGLVTPFGLGVDIFEVIQ